jgi:hypothetical protein
MSLTTSVSSKAGNSGLSADLRRPAGAAVDGAKRPSGGPGRGSAPAATCAHRLSEAKASAAHHPADAGRRTRAGRQSRSKAGVQLLPRRAVIGAPLHDSGLGTGQFLFAGSWHRCHPFLRGLRSGPRQTARRPASVRRPAVVSLPAAPADCHAGRGTGPLDATFSAPGRCHPEDAVLDAKSLPNVKMPIGDRYASLPEWKPRDAKA